MKLRELLILTLSVLYLAPVHADKLAHLRSSRQIITVDQISAPYYTIQVVALKEPPQNAEFLQNLMKYMSIIVMTALYVIQWVAMLHLVMLLMI